MKILFIHNNWTGGGAEEIFRNSFLMLQNNKQYEIKAFIFNEKIVRNTSVKLFRKRNSKVLQKVEEIFSFKSLYELSKYLAEFQPNIIHIHSFYGNLTPSILIALKKYKLKNKVKIIQTLHSYELICSNGLLYNFKQKSNCEVCVKNKYKYNIFYKNCDGRGYFTSFLRGLRGLLADMIGHKEIVDKFIVPSQFSKSKHAKNHIIANKLDVVDNFIEFFGTVEKEIKTNDIIYFGRFSQEKNILLLLKTLKILKKQDINLTLKLIGEGPEKSRLLNYINTHNLMDNVQIFPFLSKENLYKEIKTSKYMVITSLCYETFGLIYFEAILNDIIPIVPENSAFHESYLKFKVGTTYESNNIQSLTKSIIEVQLNYEKYYDLLQKNKEIIRNTYNYNKYERLILNIYNYKNY